MSYLNDKVSLIFSIKKEILIGCLREREKERECVRERERVEKEHMVMDLI